jgi:rSAM/selenodomain-associated transferase 1
MTPDVAILVFARAPVPGAAKTRLIPRLGAWGAARLQSRLTVRTLRTTLSANCGEVELHGSPRASHDFFVFCARTFHVALKDQAGHDLGERMHRAIARSLRRHKAVILVGTDCPALTPRDLRRAARLLRGQCDAVLAPAEDGGYALIGLTKVTARIFSGIAWGTSTVHAETEKRLASAGYRSRVLRTVWDVDRPEDLERLRSLRSFADRRQGARRSPGSRARSGGSGRT